MYVCTCKNLIDSNWIFFWFKTVKIYGKSTMLVGCAYKDGTQV